MAIEKSSQSHLPTSLNWILPTRFSRLWKRFHGSMEDISLKRSNAVVYGSHKSTDADDDTNGYGYFGDCENRNFVIFKMDERKPSYRKSRHRSG